jgi:hypothetical protein
MTFQVRTEKFGPKPLARPAGLAGPQGAGQGDEGVARPSAMFRASMGKPLPRGIEAARDAA